MLNTLAATKLGGSAISRIGMFLFNCNLEYVVISDVVLSKNPNKGKRVLSEKHKKKLKKTQSCQKPGTVGKLPKQTLNSNKNDDDNSDINDDEDEESSDVNISLSLGDRVAKRREKHGNSNENSNSNDNSNDNSNNNSNVSKPRRSTRSRRAKKKSSSEKTKKKASTKSKSKNKNTNKNKSKKKEKKKKKTDDDGDGDGDDEKESEYKKTIYGELYRVLVKSFDDIFFDIFSQDLSHLQEFGKVKHDVIQKEWQKAFFYPQRYRLEKFRERLANAVPKIVTSIQDKSKSVHTTKEFDEMVSNLQYHFISEVCLTYVYFFRDLFIFSSSVVVFFICFFL